MASLLVSYPPPFRNWESPVRRAWYQEAAPEGTAFPRPVEERSAAAAAEHSSPRQQINVRAFLILAPQGIRTAENIKGGLRAEIHEKERRP
jgi:hypothetical protein